MIKNPIPRFLFWGCLSSICTYFALNADVSSNTTVIKAPDVLSVLWLKFFVLVESNYITCLTISYFLLHSFFFFLIPDININFLSFLFSMIFVFFIYEKIVLSRNVCIWSNQECLQGQPNLILKYNHTTDTSMLAGS